MGAQHLFSLIFLLHAVQTSYASNAEGFCCTESLSGAINDFSFHLVEQIGGTDNLFLSPLSISIALAMTHLGARGQTAWQLERVLALRDHGLSGQEASEEFRDLLSAYERNQNLYTLLLANGMFLQQNYTVKPEYVRDLRLLYQAVVEMVDFSDDAATRKINRWVANNTRDMIKKLFDGPLDPLTRMVLLNVIYFKGIWKTTFPKDRTFEGLFFLHGGGNKTVEMMSLHKETFRFLEDEETRYKFLELPYKGDDIAMLLALPQAFEDAANLLMTSEILCRVNDSMKVSELQEVMIPKFRLEHTEMLKDVLMAMGVQDLFIAGRAELTGIRKQNDLYVSSVVHKAVIDVNEEGSEAAAVTGVVISTMSLNLNPDFVANHPFLLYIVDRRSGLILFNGRVADP